MTPNQPSRGYTRYMLPTDSPDAGPSSSVAEVLTPDSEPTIPPDDLTAGESGLGGGADTVDPREVNR